jgi:V8-like Glu-specific endopeptidase
VRGQRVRATLAGVIRAQAWLLCAGIGACASAPADVVSATSVYQAASQPAAAQVSPDLFVRCEDPTSCPEAVGMLVVDRTHNQEPERCTVTLIRPDHALTASHCLAAADRRAGAACERTWVVFPRTASTAGEAIACRRVVEATAEISESALSREHAILQLDHASARTPFAIEPAPPEPGSIVTVASITPHPIYGTTHALATRLCRVIDSTPAERALGAAAGNVGWLMNCPIARGNSGSPVIDYGGRVRAIVHGGTDLSAGIGVTSVLAN